MNIPTGATHKWMPYDFFTKRAGGSTWAVWQDERWLWIGDELGGEMVPLVSQAVPNEIIRRMQEDLCISEKLATVMYQRGYRKFEIVEEDV